LPGPGEGFPDIVFADTKLLQLVANRLCLLEACRRQDDATIVGRDLKILRRIDLGEHGLGQGHLVLGDQFGKHGNVTFFEGNKEILLPWICRCKLTGNSTVRE